MKDANKNLLVRVASAVVLIPVVIACLYFGVKSTAVLIAICSVLMVEEFTKITLKAHDLAQWMAMVAAALPAAAFALWTPVQAYAAVAALSAFLLIAVFIVYLLRGPLPEAPQRIAMVFAGFVYGAVLPSCLVGLRGVGGDSNGMKWVVLAFLLTWANDTGAYAFGRTLGKRKLYLAVSPGKSWEGYWGGMAVTIGTAFIARATFMPSLTWVDALALAIPVSILGPLGDLSESMIKRAYGVKDSGKTIPGHGGVLDRLDAMLFNAPYVFLYAVFAVEHVKLF